MAAKKTKKNIVDIKDKNTLIIHGCGGAGVNLANMITTGLSKTYGNVDGFPEWVDYYFDTTEKNVVNLDADLTRFTKVTNKAFGEDTAVDGSAGDRASNYLFIKDTVSDYLNQHGFTGHKMGEFHVVMHSSGGGSGSVIGPLLAKAMVERGIPVVVVTVGDSNTGMLARNTKNTIATLASIAKQSGHPLSIFYTNNEYMDGANRDEKLERANRRILSFMTTLSLFLSGQNFDLDNRDMEAFLDFTKNSTLAQKLKPGLYTIEVLTSDKTEVTDGCEVIMGRTLSVADSPIRDDYYLADRKVGQVVHNSAIDVFNGHFPIDLMLASGYMTVESQKLEEAVMEFDSLASKFRPEEIEIGTTGDLQDDGMVL